MNGLAWLGPVNEIPYVNEVRFVAEVDNADGLDNDPTDIAVIDEQTGPKDSLDLSDVFMKTGQKTLFGFSYKAIAIALAVALAAYILLKK